MILKGFALIPFSVWQIQKRVMSVPSFPHPPLSLKEIYLCILWSPQCPFPLPAFTALWGKFCCHLACSQARRMPSKGNELRTTQKGWSRGLSWPSSIGSPKEVRWNVRGSTVCWIMNLLRCAPQGNGYWVDYSTATRTKVLPSYTAVWRLPQTQD